MACRKSLVLVFLLLTCTVAARLGSRSYHAPGPVLYSTDIRARDVRRLKHKGLQTLRRLGGPPCSWITYQLRALHEFIISSPIRSFLQSCGWSFTLDGGSAPALSSFKGKSSTHCPRNCGLAHACIKRTVTITTLLPSTGATGDWLQLFLAAVSCDVHSDPRAWQKTLSQQLFVDRS